MLYTLYISQNNIVVCFYAQDHSEEIWESIFGSILLFYWIRNSMTRLDLIAVSIPLVHVYIVHLNMVHVLFSSIYFFFSLNWLMLLNCPMLGI